MFESQPVPGGLLVNGIPSFKLEKTLVSRRIGWIKQRGVEFRLGVGLGADLDLAGLLRDFDAVFLAMGASQTKPLNIPGADLRNVHQGLPFLVQANVAPDAVNGARIEVAGPARGGARRRRFRHGLPAQRAALRRHRGGLPLPPRPRQHARQPQGIRVRPRGGRRFEFLTNPVELLPNSNGEVAAVRCVRMELGAPDASGPPQAGPGGRLRVHQPADVVLVAYGFEPAPFPAGSDLARITVNDWGAIVVDAQQMTSVPGVFAGGDLVRGPSLVAHAIRDARKAAAAIHAFLASRSPSARRGRPGSRRRPALTAPPATPAAAPIPPPPPQGRLPLPASHGLRPAAPGCIASRPRQPARPSVFPAAHDQVDPSENRRHQEPARVAPHPADGGARQGDRGGPPARARGATALQDRRMEGTPRPLPAPRGPRQTRPRTHGRTAARRGGRGGRGRIALLRDEFPELPRRRPAHR